MTSNPADTVSVLIIVKGRRDHLENVLAGIERSTLVPNEIVVVHMNEDVYNVSSSIPLTQVAIRSDRPLPLAAARNKAANMASGSELIFLDVDCIPDVSCFSDLIAESDGGDIVMVDPHYLKTPPETVDSETLSHNAAPNPARKDIPYGKSDSYEFFWSLGFLISKTTFEKIGGFDESFVGYGGEDTDFSFTARAKHVPLVYAHARVYHQPHPEYDPPLNWFDDIITNAEAFYKKWNEWPMTGWLDSFETMGLIKRSRESIDILRSPTETEIKHAQR